jgi:hypothetical protein
MHPHEHEKMCAGLRKPDQPAYRSVAPHSSRREPQRARAPPPGDDDVLLTSAQARERIGGVTTMCIWRWMRDPRVRFPAPVKINNRNYWRLGDLRRWQAERAAGAT